MVIEVTRTGEQVKTDTLISQSTMTGLARHFRSNIRLLDIVPVDDGEGCVDFEEEIIREVKYQTI